MSVTSTRARSESVERSVQTVAAVVAMGLIIYTLSIPYAWPKWPLTITAILLGIGFVTGQVGQLAGRRTVLLRFAPDAATVAAMSVMFFALAHEQSYYLSPGWDLPALIGILGLGLIAGPVTALAREPLERSTQTVAGIAAMGVAIACLSIPWVWPRWPLTLTAALLGLGFVSGRFARIAGARPALMRLTVTIASILAIGVIIFALSHEQTEYFTPGWPLPVLAAILGVGLLIGPLAQLIRRAPEEVLTERVAELSRTRSGALDVQATELRRIERDLHDGAQARLVALSMKLGRAEDRYRDDPETAALLREAREDAAAAIRELRELARGIAPPVLSDRGLIAAVRSLAQRTGARVSVSGELTSRPRPAVETAAYFVVAESLTNAAKHAGGARVEVRVDERGGDLFVEVTDFGPGGANPDGGGLTGLRQRVEALDGALHVTSPAGVGTQVEAVLPCGR